MAGTCPICERPSDDATKPFCSKRCADVDLHRWLSGNYTIAGQDGDAGTVSPDRNIMDDYDE